MFIARRRKKLLHAKRDHISLRVEFFYQRTTNKEIAFHSHLRFSEVLLHRQKCDQPFQRFSLSR